MAANEQQPQEIVVHMISNTPRDHSDSIETFNGWKDPPADELIECTSLKILDQTAANSGASNSETVVPEGRICQVHFTMKPPFSPRVSATSDVAFCKSLQHDGLVFQKLQDSHDLQIVIQPLSIFLAHKTPGLAIFDMDSTLIQQEVIDELARKTGKYEEVAAVTEAAMRGELDFAQSLRERVAHIKGVHSSIWQSLINDVITITPGARELIKALKGLGWKTAVASGGFMPLATWLKGELGMDYALANHLAMDDEGGALTGELVPGTKVVDGSVKRDFLIELAGQNNIPMSNTIAVGDGSNDLPMMKAAGWGIAFNAKPKVQEEAPARLNSSSLLDIMYLLGFDHEEIMQAMKNGGNN